jgi:hypothetical protein
MNLCQYADVFGKPRTGLHSYRIPIIDLAVIDLVLTVVGAWLLSKVLDKSFIVVLVVLLLLGVLFHASFCVDTQLNSYIIFW